MGACGDRVTDAPVPCLPETGERAMLEAEYEYLIKRLRYVAALLGRPNPVPSREERRALRNGVPHRESAP